MKQAVSALLMLTLGASLMAGEPGPKEDRPALGFNLATLGGDMALGLEGTSAYLLDGKLAFRGSAAVALRQGNPGSAPDAMTSENYGIVKAGLVGVAGTIAGCIRLYGEGGLLVAFPKQSFSTGTTKTGGYGHFGFEFLMGRPGHQGSSYFIELGTVGVDAQADRQVGKPVYLNGFAVTTGLRVYF